MFQEMMPLLSQRRLLLMISRVDVETICVNLIPQPLKENDKDVNAALSVSLSLTGTPQALDHELPAQLAELVGAHLMLSSTLRSAKEELASAAKAAKDAAKKTAGTKAAQVTPAAKPSPSPVPTASDADPELKDGDSNTGPVVDAATTASSTSPTGNLFPPETA